MGASQVALLVKNPPASAGDVRDVHRNYLWGFCPLILSLFSFCYLEMVVFKDVFILSRTFIENLPCAILEEGMATRCSFLAWKVPWTEEPSGLQAIGS